MAVQLAAVRYSYRDNEDHPETIREGATAGVLMADVATGRDHPLMWILLLVAVTAGMLIVIGDSLRRLASS